MNTLSAVETVRRYLTTSFSSQADAYIAWEALDTLIDERDTYREALERIATTTKDDVRWLVESVETLAAENERLRDAVEKAWTFCGTTSYYEQRWFSRLAFEELAGALIALRPELFTASGQS